MCLSTLLLFLSSMVPTTITVMAVSHPTPTVLSSAPASVDHRTTPSESFVNPFAMCTFGVESSSCDPEPVLKRVLCAEAVNPFALLLQPIGYRCVQRTESVQDCEISFPDWSTIH